jgi:GNAT superfamily N-acetyltransferase
MEVAAERPRLDGPVSILAMEVHRVTPDELDAVTETITLAFQHDPVWQVALGASDGSGDDLRPFWRFYVEGAHRYDTAFTSEGAGTVSTWIPPGGTELSEEQDVEVRRLVEQLLPPARVTALFELWDRFEDHHPHHEPHAYLSLLATRPSRAGHGHGQAHLAADLARWDVAGIPTYLESSNPQNDHRYQRQGYLPIGRFETVLDQAVVTTMWRPVGG